MEKIRFKRLIKVLLYSFVLFLGIFGLALIAVGSTALVDMTIYRHWLDRYWLAPAIFDVLCGFFSLVLAALGFAGLWKESPAVLLTFAGLLGVITTIEVMAGVMAASDSSMVRTSLKKSLNDTIVRYTFSQEDKISWDNMQRNLFCCGGSHNGQWTEFVGTSRSVPISCCPGTKAAADPGKPSSTPSPLPLCKRSTDWSEMYQQGCHEPLTSQFKTRMDEMAVFSIVFAFLQIFGIALAVYFAIEVKREREIKEAVVKVLTEREAAIASRGSSQPPNDVTVVETDVENVY